MEVLKVKTTELLDEIPVAPEAGTAETMVG
jgi:hypothetical protein